MPREESEASSGSSIMSAFAYLWAKKVFFCSAAIIDNVHALVLINIGRVVHDLLHPDLHLLLLARSVPGDAVEEVDVGDGPAEGDLLLEQLQLGDLLLLLAEARSVIQA